MPKIKQLLSRIDIGLLIVISICLIAVWPFISRQALPQQTDTELHVFRLAELSRLVRAGEFYPRWAPNFYYGYGYPIFNYYAPLVYYLGLSIDLLPALGPVDAAKALFILALFLSGIGVYGFVRDYWGRLAGLLSAAAYVYSPYIQFIDPHARGDLPELFSFAVFPIALWSLDRLRLRPSSLRWLVALAAVSTLILTHNLMAMVFFGFLLAWVLWQLMTQKQTYTLKTDSRLMNQVVRFRLPLALILGVGIAAFFWLIVALEQDAVNLRSLIGTGGNFDYRNHFLNFRELASFPKLIDWRSSEPEFALSLGVIQIVLGAAGIAAIIFKKARDRLQALFYAIILTVFVFLMLPFSQVVWDNVSLLPFMQFPWRLLGPAGFALAVLAGVGLDSWTQSISSISKGLITAVLIGIILIISLPLSQVPPWPTDFGETTTKRVLDIELTGRWLGTTSTADFVPATVDIVPGPEQTNMSALRGNNPFDRINDDTLPAGAEIGFELITPLHFRYFVTSPTDFLLRLYLFQFPGWEARVDGEQVRTLRGRPEGFVVIPVPAGEHLVDIEFETTLPRVLATFISALSVIVGLIIAWKLRGVRITENKSIDKSIDSDKDLLPAAVISVGMMLTLAFLVEPLGWLRLESAQYEVDLAEHQAYGNFGDQIAFIGYDGPEPSKSNYVELSLVAYWQALEAMDINYQVFVHVLNQDGMLVAQSDKINPGEFPTKRWPMDKYVRDEHLIKMPENLLPGQYTLSIGIWSAEGGWRLPLLDENGDQVGDNYLLQDTIVRK
jgi:hypothetical protein